MSGNKLKRFLLLSSLALLAACESNDKIGTTVKGERIAVIEQAKSLDPAKDSSGVKPSLPRDIVNLSWPQAAYDREHTMPPVQIADRPQIAWKSDIGEGSDSDYKILAHPVIAQGVIYTLDAQGLVRAFDTKNGVKKWEFDTTPKDSDDKAIGGGLAIDGPLLYVTTGFGDVCALDVTNGSIKWRKSLLKPVRAAPTVADNRVYILSIDNDLNALDAQSGEVLWRQPGIAESATLMGAANPAVSGENVIVAYNSGEISSLRVQNGRVSWNYSLSGPARAGALPAIADIRGLPVVDHGRIFVIGHSGRIAAVDQRSGDRIWEAEIGGIDTPVVAGDAVFVYGEDNKLIALSRDDGHPLWIAQLQKLSDPSDKNSDRIVWTGPVLAGGQLWMVNSLGKLAGFSAEDGKPVFSTDLGSPLYLSPIVADRMLYVVTDEGKLIALK